MTAGRILGLAALCTLSGCSLLLDTDEFLAVPVLGDVRIDSREPMQALEGARLPVILRGEGFSSNATVRAIVALPGGAEESVLVAEKRASRDGTALALLLDVPVLPGHAAADELASVQITVTQGRSTASATLDLTGLSELKVASEDNQVVNAAELENLYSEIVLEGAVTVIGDDPVRLVATNTIRIDRPIEASGQDATAEQPGSGGPGGCPGGAGGVAGVDSGNGKNGGCDQGGGRAGTGVSGVGPAPSGGGGGCAAAAGDDGDQAHGDDTCTPELVPLGQPDNRGHGGGGGGAYESAGGGHGGGGGGVVELSAPIVSFGPYGELSARGGQGTPGAPLDCGQDRHAGSGGGGSGGVVLLRADKVLFSQEGIISVAGGTGGIICETSGGPGSDGRVRIDVASIQLNGRPISAPETMVDFFSRNVLRGPRLADTPQLAVSDAVLIGVRGDPEVTYDLLVDSSPPVAISGNQTLMLELEPGLRGVCVALRGVIPNSPESKHCLTIAVLDP